MAPPSSHPFPSEDQFDDLLDFPDDDEPNTRSIADKRFDNGPNLFEQEPLAQPLHGSLYNPVASPRPEDMQDRLIDAINQGEPLLPTFDEQYQGHSFSFLDGIDFGVGPTELVLPEAGYIAHQANGFDVDSTFNSSFSEVPFLSTLTAAPAMVDDATLYSQIITVQNAPTDGAPTWDLTTMGNFPQELNADHQQQVQVPVNEQAQVVQPQPRIAPVPYKHGLQDFELAERQFSLIMPSTSQLPSVSQSSRHDHASPDPQYSQSPQQTQGVPQPQIDPASQEPDLDSALQFDQYMPPAVSEFPHMCPLSTPSSFTTAASSPQVTLAAALYIEDLAEHPYESSDSHEDHIERTSGPVRTVNPYPTREELAINPFAGMAHTSLQEAEGKMLTRYIENLWQTPSSDDTIPNRPEERVFWTRTMLQAFLDTSGCKDNKHGFSFVKRWQNIDFYQLDEIEKVCWHMCHIAECLHKQGPQALNIYDPDALKRLKASRNMTFAQRIDAICDMLKLSKHLCDNLMKNEGIEALVAGPKQKMSGAQTMVKQNKKRQDWLEFGRNSNPTHPKKPSRNGSPRLEDDEHTSAPTQRKTKQTPKRPAKPRTKAKAKARARKVDREASDSGDEQHGLERRQSIFGDDDHSSTLSSPPDFEDKMMLEAERTISPTSSPAQRSAYFTSPRILRDASTPSPTLSYTSTASLTSAPDLLPSLADSSRGSVSNATTPIAQTQLKLNRSLRSKQTQAKTIAMRRATAVVISNPKNRSNKRSIDTTESDSEDEQPVRPTKRPRKASAAAKRAASLTISDAEQETDEGEKSDQEPTDVETDQSGNADEEDEDREDEDRQGENQEDEALKQDSEPESEEDDDDQDENEDQQDKDQEPDEDEEEGEEDTEQSESPTPSPSPERKRKRDTATARGHTIRSIRPLVMTAKRSTKPKPKYDEPDNNESEHNESEDERPAKRTKKTNTELVPARKSAVSAAAKSAPAKEGKNKLQRDANGRFVRRTVDPVSAPEPTRPAEPAGQSTRTSARATTRQPIPASPAESSASAAGTSRPRLRRGKFLPKRN